MIEPACLYETGLKLKYQQKVILNDTFKYWVGGPYVGDLSVKSETWDKFDLVSTHDDEILGYISFDIDRTSDIVSGVSIINFHTEEKNIRKNIIFGKDVLFAVDQMFTKFNFRKMSFFVIVGNPIEKTYDKFISRYGGSIIGVRKQHTKLTDGKYYDEKMYEIFRDDYITNKNKNKLGEK